MAIIFKGTGGTTIIKRTGGSTFVTKAQASPAILQALNPASASNLELWLAADSGASSDAEAGIVSFWDDISGNGRDFNNLGAVPRRPTFRTSQIFCSLFYFFLSTPLQCLIASLSFLVPINNTSYFPAFSQRMWSFLRSSDTHPVH